MLINSSWLGHFGITSGAALSAVWLPHWRLQAFATGPASRAGVRCWRRLRRLDQRWRGCCAERRLRPAHLSGWHRFLHCSLNVPSFCHSFLHASDSCSRWGDGWQKGSGRLKKCTFCMRLAGSSRRHTRRQARSGPCPASCCQQNHSARVVCKFPTAHSLRSGTRCASCQSQRCSKRTAGRRAGVR